VLLNSCLRLRGMLLYDGFGVVRHSQNSLAIKTNEYNDEPFSDVKELTYRKLDAHLLKRKSTF
jgi:hypothetical protein